MPYGLLTDVVAHPFFQRLRGIRQLGLSGLVYPGAQHTRFQHSLGAYHLMHEALANLQFKGAFLFDTEVEAAEAAILLHDMVTVRFRMYWKTFWYRDFHTRIFHS